MRTNTLVLAAFLLPSSFAFAEERTVRLVNPHSPQELQEMATIVRTLLHVRDLKIDDGSGSVLIGGTPEQLEMSEWLLTRLDKPAGWKPSDQERKNPAARTLHNSLRIFYLADNSQPRAVQERLTILRTVLDTQRIYNYSAQSVLVVSAPSPELEAIEWLLSALDNPTSSPYKVDHPRLDIVRVFRLAPDTSEPQMQAMLRQVRMKVSKAFTLTYPPTIIVRAAAADVATAEALLH